MPVPLLILLIVRILYRWLWMRVSAGCWCFQPGMKRTPCTVAVKLSHTLNRFCLLRHDGSVRSCVAILAACLLQESSHRFESYVKAKASTKESFTKRMSTDEARPIIQFVNVFALHIGLVWGRVLGDDSSKSAKEQLFPTIKIVVTDVDWLLGDITNSAARHLCRLVC